MSVRVWANVILWHGLLFAAIAGCYLGLAFYAGKDALVDFLAAHVEDFE